MQRTFRKGDNKMLYTWECENCLTMNTLESEPVTYMEKEATCTKCGKTQVVGGFTDGDINEETAYK